MLGYDALEVISLLIKLNCTPPFLAMSPMQLKVQHAIPQYGKTNIGCSQLF